MYAVNERMKKKGITPPPKFVEEYQKSLKYHVPTMKKCVKYNMKRKEFKDFVLKLTDEFLADKPTTILIADGEGKSAKPDFDTLYRSALSQKGKGMCFYYHHEKSLELGLMWCDREPLNNEMRRWRKLKKKGDIVINKENNRTLERAGKKWYVLVIQSPDENKMPNICPFSVGAFNFLVSGYVYYFSSEKNRDMVYEYVMKE